MRGSCSPALPSGNYRRLIDEHAVVMPNPELKLKFLKKALQDFERVSSLHRLCPPLGEIYWREILLAEAERLHPGSRALSAELIRKGTVSRPHRTLWNVYRCRHLALTAVLVALVWGLQGAAASLTGRTRPGHPRVAETAELPAHEQGAAAVVAPAAAGDSRMRHGRPAEHWRGNPRQGAAAAVAAGAQGPSAPTAPPPPEKHIEQAQARLPAVQAEAEDLASKAAGKAGLGQAVPGGNMDASASGGEGEADVHEYIEEPIWLVEKRADAEVYSNGLQIITSFEVANIPRRYVPFPHEAGRLPAETAVSSEIRGILYHASESDLVPFRPEEDRRIKSYSSQLTQYICREKKYHYFIDRFGRVFRIVLDAHAAFHAGNSVWADAQQIFLSLNHAFLGICFEGRDFEEVARPGSENSRIAATGNPAINDAQIRAGRELTDWLRFRYRIPQKSCTPHGLASVYPKDKLIGYHLDLSCGFPFARFGLEGSDKEILPSMVVYGFTYDRHFLEIFQGKAWPAIVRSEALVTQQAELAGLPVRQYRDTLQQRFDRDLEWQKELQRRMEIEPSAGEPEVGLKEEARPRRDACLSPRPPLPGLS
ncbi:MAG: peptidoglycan recognition family protein [bacterium]